MMVDLELSKGESYAFAERLKGVEIIYLFDLGPSAEMCCRWLSVCK